MRLLVSVLCALFISPVTALAAPVTPPPSVDGKQQQTPEWEIVVGGFGGVIGSFMEEPSDAKKQFVFRGTIQRIPYSGFAGVGGGGGVTVSALYKGVIGLELQLFHSKEKAKGHLDVGGIRNEIKFSKSVWHLPLLLKLAAPTRGVRPFLFGGFDFVFSSEPEIETTLVPARAIGDGYTAAHFGFGFDFMLPFDGADVRIPLMLRGSRNFGIGDSVEGLMDLDSCGLAGNELECDNAYRTAWQWQAFVSLGVSYRFE